jgi:hypothetical protein
VRSERDDSNRTTRSTVILHDDTGKSLATFLDRHVAQHRSLPQQRSSKQ